MSGDLNSALLETVDQLKTEESATATKAERLADPSIGPPPKAPAAAAPAPAQPKASSTALLMAMPPELATPILVLGLDLLVRRIALWMGGKEASERFALTPDERRQLSEVWAPVVAHYLAQLNVHPLVAAVGTTGVIYGLKALPEGGLEAALAGAVGAPAPQAVSTADLVKPNGEEKPAADPVLAAVEQAQAALKRERELEASKAVSA